MSKHSEQLPLNWIVPFLIHLKLGWAANLGQDLKKYLPADQVEGFCEVDEGNVEGPLHLTAFLLQLAEGKNHVHRGPARGIRITTWSRQA